MANCYSVHSHYEVKEMEGGIDNMFVSSYMEEKEYEKDCGLLKLTLSNKNKGNILEKVIELKIC